MRFQLLLAAAAIVSAPAVAEAPAAGPVAESKADHSTVSLEVEPKLDDGRVVLKLAAQNRTAAPIAFGPADVTIARLNGQPVPLMSLQQLTNDVRLAAGMKPDVAAPTSNTYATQAMTTDSTGHLDVSNFHGSMGISGGQIVRDTSHNKPSISRAQAQQQIDGLKQAILQDSTMAPGQIAVGELVSAPLKLAAGEDRTLHVWVKIAGDEHSFTIAAPAQ
jgi:hypothetical protein